MRVMEEPLITSTIADSARILTVQSVREVLRSSPSFDYKQKRWALLNLRVRVSVDGRVLAISGLFPHVLTVVVG